jgi:Mg-chelatase subunit ChlD
VASELKTARRRTTSRTQLNRNPAFRELSPRPGQLDEAAFAGSFRADADEALALLTEAAGSSDRELRALAKRLAGRVIIDLARGEHSPRRGVDRLRARRGVLDGDIDLDASMDTVVEAQASGVAPLLDDLVSRSWVRSEHALALIVDRSGSMGGEKLVAASLAAAVAACRAPSDYSVIAVARDALVLKAQDQVRSVDEVIDDLIALKGFGTTDLALGLRTAAAQLERSTSKNRVAVLLSDGQATSGEDPAAAARMLDRLHVVGPPGDTLAGEALARAGSGRFVALEGPMSIPAVLLRLLR